VPPPRTRLPLGPAIPLAAIAIASAILFGATRTQLIGGAAALAAGAVLFLIAVLSTRQETVFPHGDRERDGHQQPESEQQR